MIELYVREGFLYTETELKDALHFDDSLEREFKKLLEVLKRRKIIRTRKARGSVESYYDDASVISEDETAYDDYVGKESNESQYLFYFVGVFYYGERVVYVYPKYIESTKQPRQEMKKVMRVLRKHQGKHILWDEPEFIDNADQEQDINELSIALFLLNDYGNYGIYGVKESVEEINGKGAINWSKTVNQITPLIVDNRPYYFEMYTQGHVDNSTNFCTRYHSYILTVITEELDRIGLSDLFGLPILDLSEDEEDYFGDADNILDEIDKELRIQFDDRKKRVLKALEIYVQIHNDKKIRALKGNESLEFFGTRAFHKVWEDLINAVYISQKENSFKEIKKNYVPRLEHQLALSDGTTVNIEAERRLDSVIDKPAWNLKDKVTGKKDVYWPSQTFIPDYLRFGNDCKHFYIIDAKYYVPNWYKTKKKSNVIERQPGVEDVAKQYMYFMAYKRLLTANKIDVEHVENYFVMPTERQSFDAGDVGIDFFKDFIPNIFNIRVKMLNADELYTDYLLDNRYDVAKIASI